MQTNRGEAAAEPTWPVDRDLQRYNTLLGIDPTQLLENGGVWIEIGPGLAALPMLPFAGRNDVKLVAIGPHPRNLPEEIEFTRGFVPGDEPFFKRHRSSARLVTDVYGALSYCDDPIQALIYESLLLAGHGAFIAFTELYRFGGLETWERITEFFRARMGQTISFETLSVFGDASAAYSTGLRLKVRGAPSNGSRLEDLFEQASACIGIPRQARPLWTAADRSVSIARIDYLLPPP